MNYNFDHNDSQRKLPYESHRYYTINHLVIAKEKHNMNRKDTKYQTLVIKNSSIPIGEK